MPLPKYLGRTRIKHLVVKLKYETSSSGDLNADMLATATRLISLLLS
jgi:hypothetical protein